MFICNITSIMNVVFPPYFNKNRIYRKSGIILVYATNQPSLIVLGKQSKEYK